MATMRHCPITAVRLEMRERKLCFDAPSAQPLTLYYGDPALTAPQYDYARLFAPSSAMHTARLGPERRTPLTAPDPTRGPHRAPSRSAVDRAAGRGLRPRVVAIRSSKTRASLVHYRIAASTSLIQFGDFKISRGFDPSAGPTRPSLYIMSIR